MTGDFMRTEKRGRIIKQSDVRHMIGDVTNMTIWRWVNKDDYKSLDFPKPIKIKTRNYWNINAIQEWIATQAV